MKVSRHFSREEFACKCGCGFDVVDIELLKHLEKARYHFGKPVTINSGCRCKEYNKKIGGAEHSQHLLGKAADIVIKDVSPKEVQEYFNNINGGLGAYSTFTHIDVGQKRRW